MISALEELDVKISQNQIPQDAYDAWKDNPVTRRFMLDMYYQILESALTNLPGLTTEELARSAIKRNEEKDCLEAVIDWKPQELNHEH